MCLTSIISTYTQMKAFSPQLPKQRENMSLKFSLVFGETKILLIPLPEYKDSNRIVKIFLM